MRTIQLSSPLLRFSSHPTSSQSPLHSTTADRLLQTQSYFSTSTRLLKKKGSQEKPDSRVTNIRYHLFHPKIPRPLRLSRLRYLRHWTIHRAWQMHTAKLNIKKEKELQRQFQSMERACEELRLADENGIRVNESEAQGNKKVGRLYRIAMEKKRVWGPGKGFPIEYARAQTDYPSRDGWNHEWTR